MNDLTRITKHVYELLITIKSMEEEIRQIRENQEDMLIAQQAKLLEKQPERLLRASDVCKLLNVDRKTVTNWKNKGLLVPEIIGGVEFFRESEVLKFKRT